MPKTNIGTAYVQIMPSMEGISGSISKELNPALSAAGESAGKAMSSNMLKSMGSSMEKAGKTLSKTVTVPLAAAGTASIAAATQFGTSFSKLQTIADSTEVSVDDLKNGIKDLSNQTGMSASEVAEAAYSAISAGQSTGDALEFVATSSKLAKGGFTDVATATDVLTTALNAYGMSAAEAEHVSDVLITTQNLGKTTVGDLATSMGRVIPTATAANVSIEDLASQYVALTKNGIATAESTTYINSMLNELTKSGTTADLAFQAAAGKTFPEYIAAGHSTAEAMALMGTYAEDNKLKLSDMFGSAEASKAANVLASHVGDSTEALKEMLTQTGQTQEAFETMDSTAESSMNKLKTTAQNMAISVGDAILPALVPMAESVSKVVKEIGEAFSSLPQGVQTGIVAIAGIAAAIGPVLAIGGKAINLFTTISSGIGGLGGKIGDFAGKLSNFGSGASKAGTAASTAGSSFSTMAGQALLLVAAGAAVALIAAAMWVLVDAAIRLADAGPLAIGVFVGLAAVAVGVTAAIVAIGSAATATAPGLLALGAAVALVSVGIAAMTAAAALLVHEITNLVQICAQNADGIVQIIDGVADAINSTIQTIGLTIAAIIQASYSAIADGISQIIQTVGNAISGIVTSIADGIARINDSIANILDSLAGVIDSIGTAALNAGKGFDILAGAVINLVTGTNIVDLAVTLAAVAGGITKINKAADGSDTAAGKVNNLATALQILDKTGEMGLSNLEATVTAKLANISSRFSETLANIKSLFANTKLEFNQAITLPHFKMSGKFDAKTGAVPTVGVDWYKRAATQGALFSDPTVIGVGDASQPELLIGEQTLYQNISAAVGDQGDIIIPVYLGGEALDTIVVKAQQRALYRSGGH